MIAPTDTGEADPRCLHIGLINNMPDSALEATERQFRTLLSEAAEEVSVCLSLFALPEVPRSDDARRRIRASYSILGRLWNHHFDGIIVTGAEPMVSNLMEEPYWAPLTQVVDWAERNTYSSIWSCLAAHAAVLRRDGIGRRPLGDKLFGVFECATVTDHALTASIPSQFRMPHSRWNDVPGDALSACGYRVLTQLKDGRVDAFVKQGKSLSVFFQGHPEYDAASLLLEYRRDIRRFLNCKRDSYPSMPQGYFDEEAAASLRSLRARAVSDRQEQSFADFPKAIHAASMKSTWRPEAVRFYRNWLRYISEKKNQKVEIRQPRIDYKFQNVGTSTPAHLAKSGTRTGQDNGAL